MKLYLSDEKRLAFITQKATSRFWDNHWQIEGLRRHVTSCKSDSVFIPAIRRYLPENSKVLEGGCGNGLLVHALNYQNYQSIGLDFATGTVCNVKKVVPELEILAGDVFNLPFKDELFDGYISGGVIEHFIDGYSQIINEMYRVLRPGGFVFITYPYMSPLRRFKAFCGCYKTEKSFSGSEHRASFYQYALRSNVVINEFQSRGFTLEYKCKYDGIKGFKDEAPFSKFFLQKVYDGKILTSKSGYFLRTRLDLILSTVASHIEFLVLRKEGNSHQ